MITHITTHRDERQKILDEATAAAEIDADLRESHGNKFSIVHVFKVSPSPIDCLCEECGGDLPYNDGCTRCGCCENCCDCDAAE
jgi:hypothetical protein